MRFRAFASAVVVVALVRTFVGCTREVEPGDRCYSGWFGSRECPPGYVCNDSYGWTCTPDEEVRSWNDSPRERPPPPPRLDAAASADPGEDDASADAGPDDASVEPGGDAAEAEPDDDHPADLDDDDDGDAGPRCDSRASAGAE